VSTADLVITLDGDGQHPPALIPEMLRLHALGYDVVLMQRLATGRGTVKRAASSAFYRMLDRISQTRIVEDSADFRLLSRPVVDALRSMRETHRFLRGMVGWLGFRTVVLPYQERSRLAGDSKYSGGKMLRFARDAVFSFSMVPLHLALGMGVLFLLLAGFEAVYVVYLWLRGRSSALVPGWSSLMLMLLVIGGTLMIVLGVMGIYVGYIFQEVKRRPLYVVSRIRERRSNDGGA
jgi:dolichol-phosphate mannosyltransferase